MIIRMKAQARKSAEQNPVLLITAPSVEGVSPLVKINAGRMPATLKEKDI
jgi:hypothetical protein